MKGALVVSLGANASFSGEMNSCIPGWEDDDIQRRLAPAINDFASFSGGISLVVSRGGNYFLMVRRGLFIFDIYINTAAVLS